MRLADWCQRFSPLVALEETPDDLPQAWPESLLWDITGCERLFHGERRLADEAQAALERLGLVAHLAVADTIGGAWAVAHGAGSPNADAKRRPIIVPPGALAEALRPLPPVCLRLPPDALSRLGELGIERIEQLEQLARDSLPSRLGPQVLWRWDQALGRADEALVPHRPARPLEVAQAFESPLERRDALLAVVERLLAALLASLPEHRQGVARLECRLYLTDGEPLDVVIGLFRATASAGHVKQLVELRLERLALPAPVTAVRLRAETARLGCRQGELFADDAAPADAAELGFLVDRLRGRLGGKAVVRHDLVDDAQPERAWRDIPWQTDAPRRVGTKHGRQAAGNVQDHHSSDIFDDEAAPHVAVPRWWLRPLRLVRRPIAIDVWSVVPEGPLLRFRWAGRLWQVVRSWGPERIQTGWWRGPGIGRDYYRLETTSGCRFWVFRRLDDHRWFLHGWFD